MSLITVSSACALPRIVSADSRCPPSSRVSSSRSVMPITPFIGVRISWLMLARNSLLAWLATCAISPGSAARSRAARACARAVALGGTSRSCSSSDMFWRTTASTMTTAAPPTVASCTERSTSGTAQTIARLTTAARDRDQRDQSQQRLAATLPRRVRIDLRLPDRRRRSRCEREHGEREIQPGAAAGMRRSAHRHSTSSIRCRCRATRQEQQPARVQAQRASSAPSRQPRRPA